MASITAVLSYSELQSEMQPRGSLAQLKPERRRSVVLGIRAFYSTISCILTVSPPSSECLVKKRWDARIPWTEQRQAVRRQLQDCARHKLQPQFDVSLGLRTGGVSILWMKMLHQVETGQRVDHFWRNVFCLKSADGTPRFSVLPNVDKAGLVLAQMNAESERSPFSRWMQRIVTQERSRIGESIITVP